jgi:hypothetical protein
MHCNYLGRRDFISFVHRDSDDSFSSIQRTLLQFTLVE